MKIVGEKKSWIPAIDDADLDGMHSRIRPLVRAMDGQLHTVAQHDPRKQSYPWCDRVEDVDEGRLAVVKRIVTYHTWAYYGFFKPTAAEVFAMIPPDLRDSVCAFEVDGPVDADDLNRHPVALDAGYHVAITTLYGDQQQGLGEG